MLGKIDHVQIAVRNFSNSNEESSEEEVQSIGALRFVSQEDQQLCNVLLLCFSRNFSFKKQQEIIMMARRSLH